jgi:hypothetical protein
MKPLLLHPANAGTVYELLVQHDDLVAQLVEQYTFNVWALGSSPSQITQKKPHNAAFFVSEPHQIDLF